MAAQPVLRNGLVWGIGNGEDIHVWDDKWIPTATTYMVQSPRNVLDRHACVSELIDPDTRQWKDDLIAQVFLEDEVKMIRSMPLSP